MVTEMILFVNLKQWRKDFPIVTRNNCKNVRKTQKTRTPRKALKTWLTVWTTWAEEKGHSPDIVSYEAKKLDQKLQKFFAEVRKKDGSDYEPDSLRVMLASLDGRKQAAIFPLLRRESLLTAAKYSKGKLATSVNRATANVPMRQRH